MCDFYSHLVENYQTAPKIFSIVDADENQFVFYIDDIEKDSIDKDDFLSFIINKHSALCYARGSLTIDRHENTEIIIVVINVGSSTGMFCKSLVRKGNDKERTSISEFELEQAPTEKLPFSWLSKAKFFDEEKHNIYNQILDELKDKILMRKLP
jgi:hypothetical protein